MLKRLEKAGQRLVSINSAAKFRKSHGLDTRALTQSLTESCYLIGIQVDVDLNRRRAPVTNQQLEQLELR